VEVDAAFLEAEASSSFATPSPRRNGALAAADKAVETSHQVTGGVKLPNLSG